MKQRASVLITDLDNTLFDWVNIWYRSFSVMLRVLVEESGVPQERLEEEIRRVHQKHKTSEYVPLIQELPSLRMHGGHGDPTQEYASAIHAYQKARNAALALYPTVLDTLRIIKSKGALIIAYTESTRFHTVYRMRRLQLDGIIDFLYSPPDYEFPAGVSSESLRSYPSEAYALEYTKQLDTPQGVKKPDPQILLKIIDEMGAAADDVVYVGDSLLKDIAMAGQASVRSALAKYGAAADREEYELLQRVTHWTDEEIEKERWMLTKPTVQPTICLSRSFSELLTHVDFTAFESSCKTGATINI